MKIYLGYRYFNIDSHLQSRLPVLAWPTAGTAVEYPIKVPGHIGEGWSD
jgi:hypothetical protein